MTASKLKSDCSSLENAISNVTNVLLNKASQIQSITFKTDAINVKIIIEGYPNIDISLTLEEYSTIVDISTEFQIYNFLQTKILKNLYDNI